jgi:hypothetical protein
MTTFLGHDEGAGDLRTSAGGGRTVWRLGRGLRVTSANIRADGLTERDADVEGEGEPGIALGLGVWVIVDDALGYRLGIAVRVGRIQVSSVDGSQLGLAEEDGFMVIDAVGFADAEGLTVGLTVELDKSACTQCPSMKSKYSGATHCLIVVADPAGAHV